MMEDKFDIKELQKRIAEVKQENQITAKFTHQYLECLIKRHDLVNILHEDQEFDNVPESITDSLKKGEIPSEEQLSIMDTETQDYLLKDCVYMCGMGAIAWYCENLPEYEGIEPSPFDEILSMPNISPGHHTASYIVSALTLLMADLPSQDLIESLTNNFDSSEEQLEKNLEFFNELCLSIVKRYIEDQEYYG